MARSPRPSSGQQFKVVHYFQVPHPEACLSARLVRKPDSCPVTPFPGTLPGAANFLQVSGIDLLRCTQVSSSRSKRG